MPPIALALALALAQPAADDNPADLAGRLASADPGAREEAEGRLEEIGRALFVAAGYFLGHAFRAVLGHLARSFSLVMLGAFLAFASAVWLAHRLQRRRQIRVPPGAKIVIPPP